MMFESVWIRLESSPVTHRLLRGAFWSLVGTFFSRSLGLAATIFVARILGKMVYGELGIIQSTVVMFGTFAGFGMGTTASKFVAELRGTDPAKAGRIIGISSLVSWSISVTLAAVLIWLAPWLCEHTLAAPYLTIYLRASVPLLVLGGIDGAQVGVLSGFEAFRSIARVSFSKGLLNFPLVVTGALLFGLAGAIGGLISAMAVGCLLNRLALQREAARRGIPISYSCLSELPVLWRFSIPAVLAEILISITNWSAATMLVRRASGYSEMGAFNAANQWYSALMWLPFMINNVTLPVLAERLGSADRWTAAKLLKTNIKMNAAIILPVMTICCLLSPLIMRSYGKGFGRDWPTMVAALLTAGVLSIELPVGQLIAASGHMWLGFWSNVGWGLIFLTSAHSLLKWGAFGLASSRLTAYSSHAIFGLIYAAIFFVAAKKQSPTVRQIIPSMGGSD